MSSHRRITIAVVIAAACIATQGGAIGAQACVINSTAKGPLSCSVTTTVRMNVRIPSMVGVTMIATGSPAIADGPVVHAGLSVKTNRSYAVQISRAPMDSTDSFASAASRPLRVTWATPAGHAQLGDTPAQIDGLSEPRAGHEAIPVAFALERQPDVSLLDPIRLLLTVVAP